MMNRMKPFFVMLAWLVVTVVLVGAHPALAQTPTCRGPNCNGQDPGVTNCSADAQTPSDPNSTQALFDNTGAFVGLVEVRYSPACQAAWARTRIFDGTAYCPGQLLAQIQRNGDFASFTKVDYVYAKENGTCPLRSPMLYVPRPFLVTATGGIFNRYTASTLLVDPRQ
jgi:uncharacterized protein DUF2690